MKKKLIAGMTSAAVIASLSAPAFAANFADVKGTTSEKAVALLKTLGVVNGDVSGNYNPDKTITRAEFAKIAVMVAGYEAAAAAYGTTVNPFDDVPAGHWAAGYIQVAKDAGLVKGVGDNKFAPTADVKYEEVLAVVLRLLGYNDNLPGAWPSDYVIKGTQLGLTSNAAFSLGKAATRGDVALIASATLSANTVTYSKDQETFLSSGTSLLSKNFGKSVLTGVLESKSDTGVLTFDADSNSETTGDSAYTVSSDVNIVGASSIEALFGRNVQYVLDADSKVAYIVDATATSKVVTGTVGAIAAGSVTIGDTIYTLLPDTELVVYVNGVKQTGVAGINTDDEVTVILDAAGKAQAVLVKQWAPSFVADATVAKTSVNKARIDGKALDGSTAASVALGDNTQIFRDGKVATLADIQAGDVIYFTTYAAGGNTTLVEAYSTKATGKLNSYSVVGSDTIVNLGGTNYTVVAGSQAASQVLATNIGKEFKATLNKDGKVVKLEEVTASTASDLVYVQKVETGITRVIDGEIPSNTFTRVTVLHNGQSMTHFIAYGDHDGDSGTPDQAFAADPTVGAFYKLSLDSKGEVIKLDAVATTVTGTINTDGVDATNKKITVKDSSDNIDKTFNITSSAVLVGDASATAGSTDAAYITFDKLVAGQTVSLAVDSANTANATAVVVTAGLNLTNGLTAVTGVYVSKQEDQISATEKVYKVTLNVNGANQVFVHDNVNFSAVTAGNLVTLKDTASVGDGKYDTLGTVVSASKVKSVGTLANGFGAYTNDSDTTAAGTYVYDSNTKVYVVKYDGTTLARDAAVVGTISDFTNLFYATDADAANYNVEFVTGSSNVAGYPVVTDIVIFLKK